MGGKLEDTIKKSPAKKQAVAGSSIGKIRFHESAGEVHFHDDDAKLKVVLPVHVWVEAWGKLSSGEQAKFGYIDTAHGTSLTAELTAAAGQVGIDLSIDAVKFSTAFAKLQK